MVTDLKLRLPLPKDRTYEQVRKQYLLEKEIAFRLKNSTEEERKTLYLSSYQELLSQTPDHPQLSRMHDPEEQAASHRRKLALIKRFLKRSDTYLEFGPGDCRFAMSVAQQVRYVYAVDIFDQHDPDDVSPENFELIVYDGYELDLPSGSIDLIFSDQMIEHLHPEDVRSHFRLALRLLKPGGRYFFRTPNACAGPRDISKFFSDTAEGLHLKEWTYAELHELLPQIGFSRIECYRLSKGMLMRTPFIYFAAMERAMQAGPRKYRRKLADKLIGGICILAVK